MPRTYVPTVNPGDSRDRIWRAQAENINPLEVPGGVPWLKFHEQRVRRSRAGQPEPGSPVEVVVGVGRDLMMVYEPGKVIPRRHPATGEIIGSITHDEILMALYSAGHQAQLDADAAEVPAAPLQGGEG
ncbi:MAG: hypothetical protein RLZZ127_2497 [Planctomycetota bacterium]|jgi:hypothetical protein